MLLTVIGMVRVARIMRARWEPVSLGIGTALTVIGFALPAASLAFFLGVMVLVIALLTGVATKGRATGHAADCWQWRG